MNPLAPATLQFRKIEKLNLIQYKFVNACFFITFFLEINPIYYFY